MKSTIDAMNDNPQHDQRVEQTIGNLLRSGVIAAAVVAIIGGIPYLWMHGAEPLGAGYHTFRGEPTDLTHLGKILDAAREFDARAIVQLGLVVLIFTPVARVAFTLLAFLAERDWLYVAVTLLVLGVLCYGLFGSGP